MYAKFFKPLLDFLAALTALVLALIPMAVIAVVIRLTSPGPAIYRQKRVGRGKKTFTLLKFRTMKKDTPEVATHLLTNPEERITKAGRFLRRFSLDELPQLFNILTFRMSFVGPRPALWNQYDLVEERDKYGANDVTPGLTGLAQISGRDELSIGEKAALDGEYVKKMSFFYDVSLLFKTVGAVVKARGVVEGGNKSKDQDTESCPDGTTK